MKLPFLASNVTLSSRQVEDGCFLVESHLYPPLFMEGTEISLELLSAKKSNLKFSLYFFVR